MVKQPRPINLEVLTPFAIPAIRPLIGIGALVWRYTVLVPTEEVRPEGVAVRLATLEDLDNLGKYFEELRRELQEALVQGVILIERQEAFLFGGPSAKALKLLPSP